MSFLFGSSRRPRLPTPPPPIKTAEKASAAVAQRGLLDDKKRGRSGTILTSPLGILEEPELRKKTLLGQ